MSRPPKSASSAMMALLREGCETPHCSAARVKLRCSHSARKYRSWEISNPPSICGHLKVSIIRGWTSRASLEEDAATGALRESHPV